MVKDVVQVLSKEVPCSNSSKFLFRHFCAPFYPKVTALLEYLDPVIYTVWFLLYNFVAIQVTLLLSKGTAMISLCTHQVIPILSLPCSYSKSLILFSE